MHDVKSLDTDCPRSTTTDRPPIAFLLKNLNFGGTQKVLLRLANKFVRFGYPVDVMLCGADGPLRSELAPEIRVIFLDSTSMMQARRKAVTAASGPLGPLMLPLVLPFNPPKSLPYLEALARYLREQRPFALLSGSSNQNVLAALAKRLSASPVRLLLTEHVNNSQRRLDSAKFRHRFLPGLMRQVYGEANAIIGVSRAVSEDLSGLLGIDPGEVQTVYNPAVPDEIEQLAGAAVDHPWLQPGQPPVVLAAGRLGRVKDYPTLLRAFAYIKDRTDARLLILSSAKSGKKQQHRLRVLQQLSRELGIEDRFELHGFVENPFAFMARAAVFALTSRTEGFGNVVAEALACGCPVVSTATRGPMEILDNGRFGRLVPIGDSEALGQALLATLSEPRDPIPLRQRASHFSAERAARAYEEALLQIGETSTSSDLEPQPV